jgi:hypothetical protein
MGCGTSNMAVDPIKTGGESSNSTYTSSQADSIDPQRNAYKGRKGRRGSISAEVTSPSFFSSPTESTADLASLIDEKTDAERQILLFQLQSNYMCAETEDLDTVVDTMTRRELKRNDLLIKNVSSFKTNECFFVSCLRYL